ncbi:GHMP kinase (plasmid) [Mesorhizobium mediterraneum]|uniref:GHMP kinase N-terminal domain-containing protein n=1 Tax=Mesorhizobium mediterraneum TaxID=43617 RepID=A0AB36R1P8_9HYPH|nr:MULTISPECIES: GHMP kinase [Mesorhizobium]PAP98580.1 hypothetical protein CIT25_30160 [Mesorhizobium mediterraneum]RWN24648.1 MAG: GHMP kinase [Mesorhizobium sp.]RWN32518.1 MAG: GHMP kinase [Mesorhizobium sp.]WIW57280.1 GHMP kinase [Mesorhizobium mediterraneum]
MFSILLPVNQHGDLIVACNAVCAFEVVRQMPEDTHILSTKDRPNQLPQVASSSNCRGRTRATTHQQHVALGFAPGHHGEVLQGAFKDQFGRLHRGLVTMPHPHLQAVAWAAETAAPHFSVDPPGKLKVLAAIRRLSVLNPERIRPCTVRLKSNIVDGFGMGASTADVLAALRAVAKLFGLRLNASQYFRIAVEAENASDGTMFSPRTPLVAHREGHVLEMFPRKLPELGLISFNSDPNAPVFTTRIKPARYSPSEIEHFGYLRLLLAKAIAEARLELIGQVASQSAKMNQAHLPQPRFEDVLLLSRSAVGLQVAHSGRMIGILLPPDLPDTDRKVVSVMGGLREIGVVPTFFPRMN